MGDGHSSQLLAAGRNLNIWGTNMPYLEGNLLMYPFRNTCVPSGGSGDVDDSLENRSFDAAAAVGGDVVVTRMVLGTAAAAAAAAATTGDGLCDWGRRLFCFRRLWGCLGWKKIMFKI